LPLLWTGHTKQEHERQERKKKSRPPEDAAVFGAQHCDAAAHLKVLHCNFEAST